MKRRLKSWIPIAALGVGLIAPLAMGQAETERLSKPDTPYERVLRGALQRAQADLQESVEIWEDHYSWEDPWNVEVGPYYIRTIQSRRLALDIGRDLEAMLEEFKEILKPDFQAREPMRVYIFPGVTFYNQFGDEFGEHHSSIYGSFYARNSPERPVAAIYDDNMTLLRMFVTHSALHQFVDRAFSRQPPTWLEEGLASYFAFRWAYSWGVSELEKLIENGRFIPLRQLLNDSIEQYAQNGQERFIELGMFVYYLVNFREDTWMTDDENGAFVDYVRAILNGTNPSRLPFNDLITRRINELEADFKAFRFPE